jgi:hypothetical protein
VLRSTTRLGAVLLASQPLAVHEPAAGGHAAGDEGKHLGGGAVESLGIFDQAHERLRPR